MKNYFKFFIYIICFVLILVGAKYGYEYLTENYEMDNELNSNLNDTNKASGEASITLDAQTNPQNNEYKASDFKVMNAEGEFVNLSDYFGKPIVVNFWATWCGPCKAELPEFMEAYQKYGDEVEFLMVNLTDGYTDTVDGVKQFVLENNYDFPLYFDTEYDAANTYQVYSIPQTLFIDENGNIAKSYIGMINGEIIESNISSLRLGDVH